MRLLSKKIIQEQVAEQKRQQILDGVKVATKVDKLREEFAQLQRQRLDFLEGNKRALEEELQPLYTKLENLKGQVKQLAEERKELKKPLDDEWKLLEETKVIFKSQQEEFNKKEMDLEDIKVFLNNRQEEVEANLAKQKSLLKETEYNANKSREDKDESEKNLRIVNDRAYKIEKQIADRLAEVQEKEKLALFNLKAAEQVKAMNETKEKELKDKEKKVKDLYDTLARNYERLKK
jgi:chromosome segregation ATPase